MYDVIIVGAGPAGTSSARTCAAAGLKTALIDKNRFPRPKPCGGAVSEQALSYLDFTLPSDIREQECFGARLHYQGHSIEVTKQHRIAVLVSRDKFDSFLLEKAIEAGAHFFPDEKCTAMTVRPDFVEVRTDISKYQARYVIGADGVHSVVAQDVRPRFTQEEVAVALVSHVPADDRHGEENLNGHLEMYFGLAPMGYGWVFPHRGYRSVGIMGIASKSFRHQDVLSKFSRDLGIPLTDVRGHLIPLGGIKRTIQSGRILLVGDAAGFADPFHGEGISYAILSGKLAAKAVSNVVRMRSNDATAFSWYQHECERLIRENLRVARSMAKLIGRYPKLFYRIFVDNPTALEKYLDIPAGKLDYKQFWKWLMMRAPSFLLSSWVREASRRGNQDLAASIKTRAVMTDNEKIKRFVQETLGCGCPEEVFRSIDCKRDVELGGGVILHSTITIGNRLLIYVVYGNQIFFEKHLALLVSAGMNERDSGGLNRFRLVIVMDGFPGNGDAMRRTFGELQEKNENIHLHVICSNDKYLDFYH